MFFYDLTARPWQVPRLAAPGFVPAEVCTTPIPLCPITCVPLEHVSGFVTTVEEEQVGGSASIATLGEEEPAKSLGYPKKTIAPNWSVHMRTSANIQAEFAVSASRRILFSS